MKNFKCFRALAIVLAGSLTLSQGMISVLAAADPTPNPCITDYTDGWKSASPLAEIVDFSAVDSADTVHGKVQRYYYNASATMSTGEIIPAESANTSNKRLSFDLYVYDNFIPYELEFSTGTQIGANVIGGIYLNCTGANSASPAAAGESVKVGLRTSPAVSAAQISNKEWHCVDVIFTEDEVTYYIDGSKIGSHVPQATGAFIGYRFVSRSGGVADASALDPAKSGIYLDNFKTYVYSRDAQFYASAAYAEDRVTVEFSESLAEDVDTSGVVLYNTDSNEAVSTGTPVLSGKILTIPLDSSLEPGTEYMVDFSVKPTGISGNKLYSNVYFTTEASAVVREFTEDFNAVTSPVTDNTDTLKAFTAFGTYKAYINVSDTGDAGYGNALWIAGQYQSGATMNLGVQSGREFDLQNGETSVTFDMKLSNAAYTALYIQPYTTIEGVADDTELVHAGAHGVAATTAKNNQLMTLVIPPVASSPYVITRLTDTNMTRNQGRSTVNWNYKDLAFDAWYEILLPKELIITPKGERVIDFGQNFTGYIAFEADAHEGEIIEYSHAEVLDADGNFYTGNLRTAKQKIKYICREGKQSYKPHFTFMGFRYIRIDHAPRHMEPKHFKAVAIYSDMERTGHFSCSNPKVNQLYSNIIWGQKSNFLDVPTDCPQRDERLGWTGDAQVFVKTAAYNFHVKRFFEKWLNDLKAKQFDDGGVPKVVPNVLGDTASSAAWADAAVICPWQIYVSYGDKKVLHDQLDSMVSWVEYVRRRSENFLWLGDWQYGDWLGLDGGDGSYEGSSNKDFIANAYFAYSTGLLVKSLRVLGRPYAQYEALYQNIVKAFRDKFPVCKTQTECALALYFDLAENRVQTARRLAELVSVNGNKLTTGFVGTPYLLYALSDNGYAHIAYSLLLQEEYPSWLFSVNMGATTVWEHWDSQKSDGSFWKTDMNSFNHYAYGSVAAWLYEVSAGIKLDETKPAFENVILAPVTDRRLAWVEASVDTKFGTVRSKWYDKDGKIYYEFDVPNHATLILNGEKRQLNRGSYTFSADGVSTEGAALS